MGERRRIRSIRGKERRGGWEGKAERGGGVGTDETGKMRGGR